MLTFAQASLFEQVAENEFTPVALRFGGAAQRSGEILCFFSKLHVEHAERADERFKLGDAGVGVLLRFFYLFAEVLDLRFERSKQIAEILLAGIGEGL